MLRHNNELKVDISVVTKENFFMTIKSAELEISVVIEKFSIAIKNGR